MEHFKLRLNPKKCAFGVTFGLLCYIVLAKGIEVDPEKVKSYLEDGILHIEADLPAIKPPKSNRQDLQIERGSSAGQINAGKEESKE